MRRQMLVPILTIVGLLATGSTAIDRRLSFSHGRLQRSCAPWDGPAIDLRLTSEPAQCKAIAGPYIDIGVWRGLPIHSGQSVRFAPTSDAGFASRCSKVGDCERAESGTIMFDSYQTGSGASGRYELHFRGGTDVKGMFHATWCETDLICR